MTSDQFKEKLKKAISYEYIEVNLEEISEIDWKKSKYIGGHREKLFYNVDSGIFSELIDDLQHFPGCGYVTTENRQIKQGTVPKRLSCLIKNQNPGKKSKMNDPEYAGKEALASQILNLYGCATPYNLLIKDESIVDDYPFRTLSVDMVSEYFEPFSRFKCEFQGGLKKNISQIKTQFHKYKNIIGEDAIRNDLNRLCRDYAYSYLVRKLLLHDGDFDEVNAGVLIENGSLKYTNFDYECSFFDYFVSPSYKDTLEYVKRDYPDVYARFRFITELTHKSLSEIIENNEVKWVNQSHKDNVTLLMKNAKRVLATIKIIDQIPIQ